MSSLLGIVFFYIGIPALIILISRIKSVPPNTIIIIDRNTHFHKKKRHGFYLFNSRIDKVTTQVSQYPITEHYSNVFKTHEDVYYRVSFSFTYICSEPEQTLDSLSDSRRSIYDIANCAVETLFGTLDNKEMASSNYNELSSRLLHQLESTLEYFYIDVTNAVINSYLQVNEQTGREYLFRKHETSSGDPIQ